jgi:hypothetical protein
MSFVSFHNDQFIKDKYVARVKAHKEADEIIQNYGYWKNGKGCAVGCSVHGSNHKDYETELGIPEWLARVEDRIFEGLSTDRSKSWPLEFLEAIPIGKDLNKIEAPFVIFILESTLANFDHKKYPDIKSAIEECIRLYRVGDLDPSAAWSAAEAAAWSAAESAARSATLGAARSAAWSAAWSAAESAAWSAAWSATLGAAWSATLGAAWSATLAAAESAAYEKFADKLLELLGAV